MRKNWAMVLKISAQLVLQNFSETDLDSKKAYSSSFNNIIIFHYICLNLYKPLRTTGEKGGHYDLSQFRSLWMISRLTEIINYYLDLSMMQWFRFKVDKFWSVA